MPSKAVTPPRGTPEGGTKALPPIYRSMRAMGRGTERRVLTGGIEEKNYDYDYECGDLGGSKAPPLFAAEEGAGG